MDTIFHYLALQLMPGIGNLTAKTLLSHIPDPQQIFTIPTGKLLKINGIGTKTIEPLLNKSKVEEVKRKAETIINLCAKNNIQILHFTSENYPDRLKQIADAPNILYFKGKGSLNPEKSISIVGTRNATFYGKNITQKIVEDLKSQNTTVVSGLAFGIDIESHKKCLELDIPTIGVIAGGHLKIYPKVHEKIADKMMERGGILSESSPEEIPDKHLFPARNRIIAGLGDACIVVETAIKGGALITANLADSYNRLVFAVPGNIGQAYSEGCNYLIQRQKALIYTKIDDLIYHLNWDLVEKKSTISKLDFSIFNEFEIKILKLLCDYPNGVEIDEIAWKCQIQINQLAGYLLNLEFNGMVKSLPGKKYQIILK